MPFANKNLNSLRNNSSKKNTSKTSTRVGGKSGFAVIQGGEARRLTKPVGAAAAPTPVNTQSLRRENNGNDTSINLVPVGTTSVWGKDSDPSKDGELENQGDSAAIPAIKSAPWANSSAGGDGPPDSAGAGAAEAKPNVSPILKGKNWAELSDDDEDDDDEDRYDDLKTSNNNNNRSFDQDSKNEPYIDAEVYRARDDPVFRSPGGRGNPRDDPRGGGYGGGYGGGDDGYGQYGAGGGMRGDARGGYGQRSGYGGGGGYDQRYPDQRGDGGYGRQPDQHGRGGNSGGYMDQEAPGGGGRDSEAAAIERSRREIEYMKMEKEAKARRDEDERQRALYEEDIRQREAKRELQQQKRHQEINRLWERPDDFDPREHRRRKGSKGNDEQDQEEGGTTPPQPLDNAWGGKAASDGADGDLSISQLAAQEEDDARRSEAHDRGQEERRVVKEHKQAQRDSARQASDFARVEIHAAAAGGGAMKASATMGRKLFDPKTGRMVEATEEIVMKGSSNGAKEGKKKGGGASAGGPTLLQRPGGGKERVRGPAGKQQHKKGPQQHSFAVDSDDELNSEEEEELRRLEVLRQKKERAERKKRDRMAQAEGGPGSKWSSGGGGGGGGDAGVSGVATFTLSHPLDGPGGARLSFQDKLKAKKAAKKEKRKGERRTARGGGVDDGHGDGDPDNGMPLGHGLGGVIGELSDLAISTDLSGLLNAKTDTLGHSALYGSHQAHHHHHHHHHHDEDDEEIGGKVEVDLDMYGATDCISDDDDDYGGIGVDMAGILGGAGPPPVMPGIVGDFSGSGSGQRDGEEPHGEGGIGVSAGAHDDSGDGYGGRGPGGGPRGGGRGRGRGRGGRGGGGRSSSRGGGGGRGGGEGRGGGRGRGRGRGGGGGPPPGPASAS